MSLRSALYSCWDIFQKNCQHAIGVATIATNPKTAPFIPDFIKSFLIDKEGLHPNLHTPSSEGLYETYIIGTYSDNTRLPKHYQHKHDATQDKGDKYQIKVGLTHVEDKVVAAVGSRCGRVTPCGLRVHLVFVTSIGMWVAASGYNGTVAYCSINIVIFHAAELGIRQFFCIVTS